MWACWRAPTKAGPAADGSEGPRAGPVLSGRMSRVRRRVGRLRGGPSNRRPAGNLVAHAPHPGVQRTTGAHGGAAGITRRADRAAGRDQDGSRASASRATNTACSGVAQPRSTTARSRRRSPFKSAAGSSQSPGHPERSIRPAHPLRSVPATIPSSHRGTHRLFIPRCHGMNPRPGRDILSDGGHVWWICKRVRPLISWDPAKTRRGSSGTSSPSRRRGRGFRPRPLGVERGRGLHPDDGLRGVGCSSGATIYRPGPGWP